MSYRDSLIYFYLTGKQRCINIYNSIIINVAGFNDMRIMINNRQNKIMFRYFLFRFLTSFITFFNWLRNMIDIRASKLHLTKITYTGERTIILDKELITFHDISTQLNMIEPDDTMINRIFLTFELENSINEKICLKHLVNKYKDLNENYQHTLKNIFVFNNILFTQDSKINVKIIKNNKIMTLNFPFKNICDKHINYFISL